MRKIAILCFLAGQFAFGQAWSGVLSTSRAIDWSTAGAGTIPARPGICQTLTSTATFTTIRNALIACNNTGQTVLLSAGTYTMTDSINVPGIFNVTLRGAGPTQTIVNFTSFGVAGSGIYVENSPGFDTTYSGDARVQDAVPGPAGTNQSRWTAASYTAGQTALTFTSHTNLFVGTAINLDQVDNTADPSPNGGPFTMQDAAHATDGGASNIGRPGISACNSTSTANGCRGFSQQVTVVSCGTAVQGAACTSNNIVISPGLYGTQWAAARLPGAWWSPVVPATGFGVEDMTLSVSGTGPGGGNAMIYFQSMAYSWVKHVKIVNGITSATAFHKHIWFYGSNHMTARDSYFYGSRCSSESYGVDSGYNSSDNLIENNIFQKIATATIREGDAGSVFGHNYAVDNCYNGGIQQGDAYSHGIADHFGLWEGNIGSEMELDDIHGTNFLHTAFRNRYSGFDTGTENGANPGPFVAIQSYAGSRSHNIVGNVLGLTGETTGYSAESLTSTDTAANGNSVFVLGYSGFGGSHVACCNNDPFVPTVMMRWGNWDPISNTIRGCTANNTNAWPGGTNAVCTADERAGSAPVTPALASPSTTLPNSFYLPAGTPSWWGVTGKPAISYPAIGPDVSGGNIANTGGHANLNPAATCYLNVMGGATNGSSGPLAFTCSYAAPVTPPAAAPTFSPSAGSFNTFQNITISDTSSGAVICFNVSGSPATNGSTGCAPGSALYTAPFQLSATTTVFAVAGGTGFADSSVASITYTINPTAQLPAVKVNNTEYIGTTTNTINFPNAWTCGVTNFGPYANTGSGLQTAINNAESCRTTSGAGILIKIPHGTSLSIGNGWSLPQTGGDTSTNFIVLTSDTPLPLGTPVCSHGIQDNVSRSTQIRLRNLGCDGSHVSYQLGTTIFPVNYALDTLVSTGATAITLANGTVTNTSAYNDKASMYHLQCTTVNCSVITTGAPDATTNCSGGPCSPHHYAILNGEFNPIGGPAGTIITYSGVIAIGTQSETTVATLPNHIHLGYDYIHGDIGDAPLDPITQLATGGPNGSTAIANGVAFLGCTNCSLVYSYFDQLLRPSGGITNSEGHTVFLSEAGQMKIVHNVGEGSAIGLFSGGWAFTISQPDEAGTDVEDRANVWTYPYSWTLARDAGFCYNNLSCPIGNAANTYGRKNSHESKIANRWLTDGDILEHSDNSGGQSGIIKSIKVESCCEAYTMKNQNQTFTNNILRDGCEGGSWGFRSSGPGSGGGASLPTQIALWQNNLTYDIAGGNPACSGSVSMGFRISNNISQTWPNSTCIRDSAGLTTTCTLTAVAGNNQSDMNIGDPVTIANCVDTTFNTNQNILNPALPGTTPTGLAIVYANAGTANATTTGCLFDYSVGWPRYLIYNHNSEFNKPTTAIDPYFVGPGSSTANQMFSRNLTFTNGIFYGGGIFASGFSEGLKVFQVPAGEVDAASFTFHDDYFADRDARASCPGHGAGANGIAQCYIEYSNAHVATQPPVTISGIPTASGDFCGAAGLPVLNDWHDYRLAHGEAACGSVTSPFANAATDGTDLGFNYAAVDAAQTSILYPAPGFFSDTPVIPATFFGLHWKISNFPPLVPSGSVRLWDSLTRWQLLNPSNGVFDFTNLDTNLQDAKTLGVDVLFTLSTTPNYISSDPTNATCNYNSTATGGCGVPTDIAASCTNVNGAHNCDGKVDGTNQHWRTWVYTAGNHIVGLNPAVYAIPSAYEIWNEASQQGTSGAGTCAQIGGTSWEGTCAQMVKMYSDANCILTGRGLGCSAGAMGVPAVGIFPAAIVTSPSSVMTAPESNWYGAYLLTSGATTNLDIAAVHGYTQGGSCCAQPETIITRYTTAAAKTSAASFTGPIWSTEGGWGQSNSEPDVDLQAAFVTRYYLLGWNAGFQRLYWYSYDSLFGTLWNSGTGLTKAGVSYGQIYGWMVGSVISTPFTATGTVWSGVLTNSTGDHLIMWDTAQTCSGGSCTTANQPVATTWLSYQDMTTASTPIAIAATHLVPIGAKPVIFQQSIVTHGAGVNPVILGMNRGPE